MKYQTIQALRALAAFMVLLFHSNLALPGGEVRQSLFWLPGFTDYGDFGVSLFFVISGFIIATVVDRPTFALGTYIWRRFWRIYPLLWIVTLVGIYHFYLRGWFGSDFISQGKIGWLFSFGALPQEGYPFWNPGWTLEHEVLFYAMAALLAPIIRLPGLCAVLFALAVSGLVFDFGWDFHLTAYPQAYFAFGILAYLLLPVMPMWVTAAFAVTGLATTYARLYGLIWFPGPLLDYTFGTGAAAVMVYLAKWEMQAAKANPDRRFVPRPLVLMGDASYSLYLWHWLLIPISGMFFELYGKAADAEVWRLLFVLTAVLVSLLSFWMIETPIIRFSHERR